MIVVPRNEAENAMLCQWAARVIGQDPFHNARAIGVSRNGELVGAVVLHDWSHPNIFLSWAATTPYWMSRGLIRAIYDWAYVQLGCSRITGLVERTNKRARRIDERLGMKLEGVIRKASPNGKDLMIYGLLRSEADELIARMK